MPVSSLTFIPQIAERSEATPGLFNRILSIISRDLDQLNNDGVGAASGFIKRGAGSPEGVVIGDPGFEYQQSDATGGFVGHWYKDSGSSNTGWRGMNGFAGSGENAIRMGRSAEAAGINAVAFGNSAQAEQSAAVAVGYQATVHQPSGTAVGANSRISGANGIAIGPNAFVGYQDGLAVGSAATSGATGGWAFGPGVRVSHESCLMISYVPASSVASNQFRVFYPDSLFSGQLGSNGTLRTVAAFMSLGGRQVSLLSQPASSTASGQEGEWSFGTQFFYVCVSTNSWKRATLSGY